MLIHLRLHHIILYIIADHTLAYWMTLCCIIYFSLILGNANFSND